MFKPIFFLVLSLPLLLLNGCELNNNSFPPEAETALRQQLHEGAKNIKIEATGAGKLLPEDKAYGRDRAFCVHLQFDGEFRSRPSHWASSLVIFRIGNSWDIPYLDMARVGWDRRSCPGGWVGREGQSHGFD